MASLDETAYFPNDILHAWTYDNQYYVVASNMRIYCSSDKFTASTQEIGKLPEPSACMIEVHQLYVPDSEERFTVNDNQYGDFTKIITSLFVSGGNILIEYFDTITELITTYVSRSFGSTWKTLTSIHTTTPEYVSNYSVLKGKCWRGGLSSFMVADEDGCNLYVFKPLFKEVDSLNYPGRYDVAGWLVVNDSDVIVSNSSIINQNKSVFENRFKDSGVVSIKNPLFDDTNHMANTKEVFRKPYTIAWPFPRMLTQSVDFYEASEYSLEHKGYVVNPVDVVRYMYEDSLYMIARVPYGVETRLGSVAIVGDGMQTPDTIVFNIPVLYAIKVDTIRNATIDSKFSIRTIDVLGFDTNLAALSSAVYTKNLGVYSFINKYLCDAGNLIHEFIIPGAIHDSSDVEVSMSYSLIDHFANKCSGDIMKVRDPGTNKDIAAFISRGRVKVCTSDPTKEINWIDVTKNNTYRQKTNEDRIRLTGSIDDSLPTETFMNVWDNSMTVMRYDIDDDRVLGYCKYVATGDNPQLQFTFPSIVKNAGMYTVGTVGKSTFPFEPGGIATTAIYNNIELNILEDEGSDDSRNLYYGGFVGAERGFVGALTDFVNGILVPNQADYPVIPVFVNPPYLGGSASAPSTLAILDDVKRSPSAVVQPGRLSVVFGNTTVGSLRGGVVSNIGVNSGIYYIELSNITSPNLFFGLAKPTADMTKEPGADASVIAIGLNGTVTFGGKLIYKHSVPIIESADEASGAVIGILINLDNNTIQYTDVDGSWYATAISSIPKGVLHFYIGSVDDFREPKIPTSVSINMGAFPFTYTIPSYAHAGFGII